MEVLEAEKKEADTASKLREVQYFLHCEQWNRKKFVSYRIYGSSYSKLITSLFLQFYSRKQKTMIKLTSNRRCLSVAQNRRRDGEQKGEHEKTDINFLTDELNSKKDMNL